MHDAGLLSDFSLVLGVAALTGLIFRLLGQPSILGYLFAGLLVGPYIPIPLFADPERVHTLSEFGVVLVMFGVGLEFRLNKLLSVLPNAGLTSVIQITSLAVLGFLLGKAFGWDTIASLFLGASICFSSTMAVSSIFEQQKIDEASRRVSLGVLVLQDVAAIAVIAMMTAIAKGAEASLSEGILILAKLGAVLFAIIAIGMFLIPRIVKLLARTQSREVLVVGNVGICFAFAVLASKLGYSAALGSFLAGILVAESGLGHQVEEATSSVRDIFSAIFFVSIGMSVDPSAAYHSLPTALAVLAVVIFGQLFSVTLGGLLSGNGVRRSISGGLALGQIGEFAFIVASIGAAAKVIPDSLPAVLVTVAVISTFSTAQLFKRRKQLSQFVEDAMPARFHRQLAVYEGWLETLRKPGPSSQSKIKKGLGFIALDLILAVILTFIFVVWEEKFESYIIAHLKLSETYRIATRFSLLSLCLAPVIIPFLINGRTLLNHLSDAIFEEAKSPARSLFRALVGTLLLSTLGGLTALAVGVAVGFNIAFGVFAICLVIAAFIVWKRADEAELDFSSGGMAFLRTIHSQGSEEISIDAKPSFHGLGKIKEFTIKIDDYAHQRSLTELALRSLTDVSVVALKDASDHFKLTVPDEPLIEGQILFLAGQEEDVLSAVKYLRHGPHKLNT